jgi:H+-translocating NAD(P) transhydrogenase subunit alpha
MAQTIFIAKESHVSEKRVAGSPETVKKLAGRGFAVLVEKSAGVASGISDAAFIEAGAKIGSAMDVAKADIALRVRRPNAAETKAMKPGAAVFAAMDPYGSEGDVAAMGTAGLSAFAMEFMPRITRAQSMDILSSQANLAGYRAVIDGAEQYGRALPMMMTAAGTVPAAKVFIMGVGVAGLQAIATARRLGAIVTATDVRPATKEQVESLGAKFLAVEDDEFKQAQTTGGYAKEMSKEYQAKQAELTAAHIAKQDIVITTALIPGRPAPRLVTKEMVAAMKPGSVLVDLAVERGGNVEGAKLGQIVETNGVKIVGYDNVPSRVAASASLLFAKNLFTYLETMISKENVFAIPMEDELVKATLLTHGGKVVHPNFAKADAPKAETGKQVVAKAAPANKAATAKAPLVQAPAKAAPVKKAAAVKVPAVKAPAKAAASIPVLKAAAAKPAAVKKPAVKGAKS